jgi:Anti-sigma-K factor rskA, C-terminal/Putative zinc-finger
MTDPRNPMPRGLTHDEVMDLASSFVLDALEPAEMAAVRDHLATCAESHDEIAELGGVVPVLAASVPVVEPPASLKARVMAAAAADLEARQIAADSTTIEEAPAPPRPAGAVVRPIQRGPSRLAAWAVGIAAVIAVVALGAWNLSLQRQLDDAQAYQQQVAAVLDAAEQPGSLTAVLRGADPAAPSGFAAVTSDGVARIAMRDLAPVSGSEVYEAWVIAADGVPVALGELQLQAGGVGYLEAGGLPAESGIVLALTREPGPDAKAPSTAPISAGTATPAQSQRTRPEARAHPNLGTARVPSARGERRTTPLRRESDRQPSPTTSMGRDSQPIQSLTDLVEGVVQSATAPLGVELLDGRLSPGD